MKSKLSTLFNEYVQRSSRESSSSQAQNSQPQAHEATIGSGIGDPSPWIDMDVSLCFSLTYF